MRKSKRLAFTLIEVMVALILSTIVMSVLLFYYFQVSQASALGEAASVEAFKMRYLENRLQDLVLRLVPPDNQSRFFFTPSPQMGLFSSGTADLLFSYNNGIVSEIPLRGTTLGRLFVDPEKRLTLMSWQDRKEWKEDSLPRFHREILLEDVQEFGIDFFIGPKTDAEQSSAARDEIRFSKWQTNWKKEFKELPIIIRFSLMVDDKKRVYTFPLPHAKVIYRS
ncbi:hypothetical protein PHSC3_000145 [Chlamydiales bacterium STE3]|nr:hypothetical protein PHSC3_000145 [Chlamydiales bacterium STE3]